MKIQIVILDNKDNILDYKDFKLDNRDGINIYIWSWMVRPEANRVQMRKWNE